MNEMLEHSQDEVADLFHILSRYQTFQHHNQQEVLYLEGETPAGVYLIHSGEVDLVFDGHDGGVRPLSIARAGQVLGISSVLSGRPHSSSATTRAQTAVGFIERETFLSFLEGSPNAWLGVVHLLSRDVKGSYQTHRLITARS